MIGTILIIGLLISAAYIMPLHAEPVTYGESEEESAFKREEFECYRDGMRISGELLLPNQGGVMPLVILAHGYGGNRYDVSDYAAVLAEHGIAACIFDFIGGGAKIESDGKTTQMSVLTEAEDLNVILDRMRSDPRFDPDQIFLFGESQGGFVATYVAENRPEDIAALILLYPAYEIADEARSLAPDPENIPERLVDMGTLIGKIYLEDAMSVDIYEKMNEFNKRVIIFHGSEDPIVPISYLEKALDIFPQAEYIEVEGGEHGFRGEILLDVAKIVVDFVNEVLSEL